MNVVDVYAHLQKYIALRQAMGYPTSVDSRLLNRFIEHLQKHQLPGGITAQVVLDWVCPEGSNYSPGWQQRRLSLVRGFLINLRASFADVQVPSSDAIQMVRRPTPHIYPKSEIVALMKAALELGPEGSLRPFTYHTLFGLVASCGLRAREAIRLDVNDVILDEGIPQLCIRETKFGKSRLTPVHRTTAHALRLYRNRRDELEHIGLTDRFFVSNKGKALTYHTVARTFVGLARRLGLRGPVCQRGANLHGLRHTFAVSRMRTWYEQGLDVRALMPDLSIYMGHTRIGATYWYLSATPLALLEAAASKFEAFSLNGGAQ